MNNGDVGGSRGRGRGWQQNDNQPRELRRPKTVVEGNHDLIMYNFKQHFQKMNINEWWSDDVIHCSSMHTETPGESFKDFHR